LAEIPSAIEQTKIIKNGINPVRKIGIVYRKGSSVAINVV
jgi:hypothetical protein